MINNATEELVESLLKEIIEKEPDAFNCKCDMCLDDIRAIALNHLPTKYYSHSIGQTYMNFKNFEVQNRAAALTELMKAIKLVSENPMHIDRSESNANAERNMKWNVQDYKNNT